MKFLKLYLPGLILFWATCISAQGKNDTVYKVFQFPANKIPSIDGELSDWKLVPESYAVKTDQLVDDTKHYDSINKKTIDVSVKVAWIKGLNRLYFLYEATDNYWDFSSKDLHHDIFEVVVDGDASGGPFIDRFHPNKKIDPMDAWFSYHGVQAQNYHIYTPNAEMDWTLAWGSQNWIKELPYANAAYKYSFKPGEAGKLILEFWITPFDYAGNTPDRAVESVLTENKLIGLGWAILDYDDPKNPKQDGFWNLSRKHTMYGNASELPMFKLMPLEKEFQKAIDAKWSFILLDEKLRQVAFHDESVGKVSKWLWDFGDGTTSTEQHPVHTYKKPDKYIVTLSVEGEAGSSKLTKVWDVVVR
ncbi:PKD domain containing protein [Sphingobacteriaceae bacterium]|nr:PKD domain containing protein [Sphingobacteriaceae bacterium]